MPHLDHRPPRALLTASPAAFAAAAALALALACRDSSPVQARPPPAAELSALSGTYEVRGLTVQASSGQQREVSGTLRLEVIGERYEVKFELGTTAPDFEEPVPVEVRGTGRGFVVGDVFTGTTEEWMTLEAPERLDQIEPGGGALPAKAGRKIVSTSRASFDAEGALQIVMQNYPGRGEHYEASMTVLEGRRVGSQPEGGR